jgi:hypothetical protein
MATMRLTVSAIIAALGVVLGIAAATHAPNACHLHSCGVLQLLRMLVLGAFAA